jgi:hypothetical protein
MSLDDLGNIGEVIGAIAVVVSLLYLASQIRSNTRAVRASAVDSSISHSMGVRQSIFESGELARIYREGSQDPLALSEQDIFRFRLMCHNMLLSHWNIFSQTQFANLSTETWSSQIPVVRRMLSSEGGKWFWENYHHEFESGFQEEVARLLAESPGNNVTG